MAAFDPSKLKKHSMKGSFGVKTQKNEIDDSKSVVLRVQQDFLTSRLKNSLRTKRGKLKLPSLYKFTGNQVQLYEDALRGLGVETELNNSQEYSIDKSGYCPDIGLSSLEDQTDNTALDYLENNFIFISSQQIDKSIINPRFSFLDRVLTSTKNKYEQTIVTFNRGEAILGNVTNVIINDGVERFIKEEKYQDKESIYLDVMIDTPQNAIEDYQAIKNSITEIKKVPEIVTDKKKITHLYDLAAKIKSQHKKLTDLVLPEKSEFTYPVDCFQYSDQIFELFYIFKDKPIFIFFTADDSGELIEDYFDDEFTILNGNNFSSLINNLLDIEILDYLVENIESIRDSDIKRSSSLFSGIKAITGNAESELSDDWHELNDVVTVLRMSDPVEILKKTNADSNANSEQDTDLEFVRRNFIKCLNSELKSKIIFPRAEAEDSLICSLISKCSYTDSIKLYRDTKEFVFRFSAMEDKDKIEVLKDIDKNMKFENQNNLLVNYWLDKNHKEICNNTGITFSVS